MFDFLKGVVDYIPGVDTVPDHERPFAKLFGINPPAVEARGSLAAPDVNAAPGGPVSMPEYAPPEVGFLESIFGSPTNIDRKKEAYDVNYKNRVGKIAADREAHASNQAWNARFKQAMEAGHPPAVAMAYAANPSKYAENISDSYGTNFEASTLKPGDRRVGFDGEEIARGLEAVADPVNWQTKLGQNNEWFQINPQTGDTRGTGVIAPEKTPLATTNVTVGGGDSRPQIGAITQGFQAVFDPATGKYRMEKIEGGPVDLADERRADRQDRAGGTVVQDLGRALELLSDSEWAAGPLSGHTRHVPGTPAHQVHQFLESVASNIGIDQLQAMRESSPTGGALGQVPFQQQKRLEQMLGSLDVTQRQAVLIDNVKRIMNLYNDIIHGEGQGPRRFELSFDEMGRPIGSDSPGGNSAPDGVDQDIWDEMTPEQKALWDE